MSQSRSERQLHYLQQMGITVWQARAAQPAEAAQVETTVVVIDWEALHSAVATCQLCPLSKTRTQAVADAGNRAGRLYVVCLAPAGAEDRLGTPFAGRAGQLLDRMLAAAGWPREQVFITNLVKCRPPEQREPQALEITACAPNLQQQLNLVQPDLVLAVGTTVAQQLLQTEATLESLRGRVHPYGEQPWSLLVTYDPGYLLQSPAAQRGAWDDMKLMRSLLAKTAA